MKRLQGDMVLLGEENYAGKSIIGGLGEGRSVSKPMAASDTTDCSNNEFSNTTQNTRTHNTHVHMHIAYMVLTHI